MNRMNHLIFHIDRDDSTAKFWISPVHLARNTGFTSKELNHLEKLVQENENKIMEAWNEYFGTGI